MNSRNRKFALVMVKISQSKTEEPSRSYFVKNFTFKLKFHFWIIHDDFHTYKNIHLYIFTLPGQKDKNFTF